MSPTGGGVLTSYGKSTAPELSMFQLPQEFIDTKILTGGDVRYLWYKEQTNTSEFKTEYLMQADLELGYNGESFGFAIEAGQYHSLPRDKLLSYSHFVTYQFPKNNHVRVGRFAPAFGINSENHRLPGRNQFFSEKKVSFNAEYSYLGQKNFVIATLIGNCQGPLVNSDYEDSCNPKEDYQGWTVEAGRTFSKGIYSTLSLAQTRSKTKAVQAGALTWTLGNKFFYNLGEYTHYREVIELGKTKIENVGWTDFVMTLSGFDIGYSFIRNPNNQNGKGFFIRLLPLQGFEVTIKQLKYSDYNEFLTVLHLYF